MSRTLSAAEPDDALLFKRQRVCTPPVMPCTTNTGVQRVSGGASSSRRAKGCGACVSCTGFSFNRAALIRHVGPGSPSAAPRRPGFLPSGGAPIHWPRRWGRRAGRCLLRALRGPGRTGQPPQQALGCAAVAALSALGTTARLPARRSSFKTSEWMVWWPAGLASPTIYFYLRQKQLRYLLRSGHA